ncbi:MAG: hypothetical protein PHD43_16965 [Methylococcales bacterium]|nr:hypothetical protein [Methylococcales bacterium]
MPLPVVTVIVVDPVPVTVVGLKLADAPVGSPPALKPTVPLKPPEGATVTVYVVLAPAATDCVPGVAESEKSGLGVAVPASAAPFNVTLPVPEFIVHVTVKVFPAPAALYVNV